MNKRGSHVGVIASFGIFVLFLVGMYFVIEPSLKFQRSQQGVLDSVRKDVEEHLSSNIGTAIVSSSGTDCLIVSKSDLGIGNQGIIVKDENGNLVDGGFDGSNVVIDPGTAIWVYYSDEFPTSSKSDAGCIPPAIESVRRSQQISENKINDAINNFEAFKENIILPSSADFSMSFILDDGTLLEAGERNVSTEIYVDESRIHYVDDQANILGGKLVIKAWNY